MTVYITSDLHFGHKNILQFCPESRPFTDIHEMNEQLVEQWNNTIGINDVIYHLGDFSLKGKQFTENFLSQLNGDKVFVLGNHDQHNKQLFKRYGKVYDYLSFKHDGTKIVMFHYPIMHWDTKEHGSIHFYGHCVDDSTEILTNDGFKFHDQLKDTDLIGTMNPNSGEFEWNPLSTKVHHVYYSGDVYTIQNQSISQRVTRNHRMPHLTNNGGYDICYSEDLHDEVLTRVPLFKSCTKDNNTQIKLSDDLLRLYICMVTDGTLKKETNLARFRVLKDRKVKYLEKLLQSLCVSYNKHTQKNGMISLNFYLPDELRGYKIKGMDEFLTDCSEKQFHLILDAIANTDGRFGDNGSVFYYTSKISEVDIIQTCAVKNGYICNYKERKGHGYSNESGYQLYIQKSNTGVSRIVKNKTKKETVEDEHFWCVTVDNGNFFMRRNGKISLTGNCHGDCYREERCIDVGYDANHGQILLLEDAIQLAKEKQHINKRSR